jgi:hypothetical protein
VDFSGPSDDDPTVDDVRSRKQNRRTAAAREP